MWGWTKVGRFGTFPFEGPGRRCLIDHGRGVYFRNYKLKSIMIDGKGRKYNLSEESFIIIIINRIGKQ